MCTCHGQSVLFFHIEAKNKLLFRLVFPLGGAIVPFYSNQPPSGLVVSPLLSTPLHVLIRNGVPNIIFQAITVFADQTEGLVSSPSLTRCPPFLQGLVSFLPSLRHHNGGGGLVRIARVAAAGYTKNDFLSGTFFFNGLENVDWHAARLFSYREVYTLESTNLWISTLKFLYSSFLLTSVFWIFHLGAIKFMNLSSAI